MSDPGVEFVVCPLCHKIIHRHDARPLTSRASVPSRRTEGAASLLTEMMLDMELAHRLRIQAAEDACLYHYAQKHRVRHWLWTRTRWDALMNRRWLLVGETEGEKFQFPKR